MYCPMKFNQISGHSEGFGPVIDDSFNNCLCDKKNVPGGLINMKVVQLKI